VVNNSEATVTNIVTGRSQREKTKYRKFCATLAGRSGELAEDDITPVRVLDAERERVAPAATADDVLAARGDRAADVLRAVEESAEPVEVLRTLADAVAADAAFTVLVVVVLNAGREES
jgi:hypothetical protein